MATYGPKNQGDYRCLVIRQEGGGHDFPWGGPAPMLRLQQWLMVVSTGAAAQVLLAHVWLPAAALSLALNFLHRHHEMSNTIATFAVAGSHKKRKEVLWFAPLFFNPLVLWTHLSRSLCSLAQKSMTRIRIL